MSDDLNKKIRQIADMLGGQDNLADNLQGFINLLGGSGNKSKEEPETRAVEPPPPNPPKEDRSSRSDLEDNIDMIHRVKKVMDRMKTNNDPRVNLLMAIKPFMSGKRQKKVSNCIRMIQMSGLTRLLDEHDKGNQ